MTTQTEHGIDRKSFDATLEQHSVKGLMCRDTISVDWQGAVFDCDFNQQLGMHVGDGGQPLHLWDLDLEDWLRRPIRTGEHCFGCTAGQGSSCGGAVA